MPIYEYVCNKCEKTNDVMQKVSDPAPATCPSCSAEGTLTRVVSRTSFVLKGGGWYSDLYGSTKKGANDSSSSKSESSASSSSSSSSESSSASASSTSSGSSDGTAKKAANA